MRFSGYAGLGMVVLLVSAIPAGAGVDMANVVGLWLFDEGQGTVVNDNSGRENHGTFNGALQWTAGMFGSALDCATAGHVLVKDNDSLDLEQAWTVAIWVKINPPMDRWQTILNKRFDVATNYVIRLSQDRSRWEVMINNGGWVRVSDPNPPKEAEWVHLAGVYNGVDTLSLFVDGEQVASRAGTNPPPANNIDLRLGSYSGNSGGMDGMMDETAVFNVALEAVDIQLIVQEGLAVALNLGGAGSKAASPSPEDGATEVPTDAVLNWTAGAFAATHDVYFGTTFADANTADRANPMGVLAGQDETATTYTPVGPLDYGQTYFWRIDEVNAATDDTLFRGDIWSFTTEPFAYPLTAVTATASDSQAGTSPQKTVDGSGLNAEDQHSTELAQMWMSGTLPSWIQYEFDKVYKLHELWVWNSNQIIESVIGFGARNVAVEYSTDGVAWTALAEVPEFAQASGLPAYTANTVVDLGGVPARFVKLTIDQNWGGLTPQTGLSEVRFFQIPLYARLPQPADGATGVGLDIDLSWRPGREATSHEIHFGDDAGVANSAPAATVTAHSYTPGLLNLGTTYHWKVDEVGPAGLYEGSLWSFTTRDYTVIEDFESYNDAADRIFNTWIDGWENQTGSQVGYVEAPFAETKIVHGGRQSMPLHYDNAASPYYSEAERTFDDPQDWTAHGADTLTLWVRGHPAATADDPLSGNAPADLYVTVRDSAGKTATVTHPTAVTTSTWTEWRIPLDSLVGVNVGRVEKLTIGVGDKAAPKAGGAGLIYIDDIQLKKL